VCHFLNDSKVLDDFLDGIEHIKALDEFFGHVSTVSERLGSILDSKNATEFAQASKRAQLQTLADTLRVNYPGARQCAHCGCGPINKNGACAALNSHDGETLRGSDGQALYTEDGREVKINNRCPGCGQLNADWNSMPPWDGRLPRAVLEAEGVFDATEIVAAAEKKWNFLDIVEQLALTVDDLRSDSISGIIQTIVRANESQDLHRPLLGQGASDALDAIRDMLPQVRRVIHTYISI
jgi:hypothetical protein